MLNQHYLTLLTVRPSGPPDVCWELTLLNNVHDLLSHELSSKIHLLIIFAVKRPHIGNTFHIFLHPKNNLETGYSSYQSNQYISTVSIFLINQWVLKKETSQLVLLLFPPYHTSLFIFIWLPFLWSSFIHICIYIVRRNLMEWQWLFFVWIVKVEGSRTLAQAHYTTHASSSISSLLLCQPSPLSALYFWTYNDVVRSLFSS